MSVYLEFQLDAGSIDGSTLYTFDAADWSRIATGPNAFLATLPAAQALGIIDPLEIVNGLEDEFGPIEGRVAPDVGSRALITDFVVERVITNTPGNTLVPTLGTHSPAGVPDAAGVRLRETPQALITLVATQHQAGGTGQVSSALFANGVSGVDVCPTGMRLWFLSGADAGDHTIGLWLFPLVGPDAAEFLLAGQPAPVFA